MKVTTTRRRRLIKATEASLRTRCAMCGREVELLSLNQAAKILQGDWEVLNRCIADDLVHTTRTINGDLWVCKDSLFL